MTETVGWDHMVEGARVRFRPGQRNDPATADNIDADVCLADGTRRYATFMTTNEIGRLLQGWAGTGEVGGGRYFWCSDLVIVPRPGVEAMVAALGEMIRSGDIDVMLGKVEDSSVDETKGTPAEEIFGRRDARTTTRAGR
ncbi:hypothetical protein ACQP0U_08850 [Micromonospora sp. CA-269861]|uniref:hypothetical protein n=1 Tax=Micromonospora sp. CA-269861 TaxID=3239968 RepID=UPI003D8A260A